MWAWPIEIPPAPNMGVSYNVWTRAQINEVIVIVKTIYKDLVDMKTW